MQVGDTFAMWRLVSHEPRISPKGKKEDGWVCECACDNHTVRWVRSSNLKSGNSKSCGCLSHIGKIKHGLSRTREYKIYKGMMARCYDPAHDSFKYYGGRSDNPIFVCAEWKESFETFYSDIQSLDGYSPGVVGLSLDRIDVNGCYCPENCRWITNLDQQNNKRNTLFVHLGDESNISLASLARETGIDYARLYRMIEYHKDTETVSEIIERAKAKQSHINLASIARSMCVPYNKLYYQHVIKGLPIAEAIKAARQISER